jgi:sigma-54 dependent transcriptional regulator, acetoin dehydrogenase operon transcriptional activator AcoR
LGLLSQKVTVVLQALCTATLKGDQYMTIANIDSIGNRSDSAVLMHEAIANSHERSRQYGLCPNETPEFSAGLKAEFKMAVEANQSLLRRSAPIMDMLYEQIAGAHSMLVLTDSAGTILHSLGDDDFLQRAQKVALAKGVNWSERNKGTNAIGTAIATQAPSLVHGEEHYFKSNHFLTCSAAPIFGPTGSMFGVLDVTGDQRSYQAHTLALMRMSARMIEDGLFNDEFKSVTVMRFHERSEFLGSLQECLVALSSDGKLIGANRAALQCMGISEHQLSLQSALSMFGATHGELHDRGSKAADKPLVLCLPNGRTISTSVRPAPSSAAFAASSGVARAFSIEKLGKDHTETTGQVHSSAATACHATSGVSLSSLRTSDAQINSVIDKIERTLNRDIPLLLMGDTGTGKEWMARAYHVSSNRNKGPFVALNCAALPEGLIESELFGYEEGAFTGAKRRGAQGKIAQADGGTLFLDEIGDMPSSLQGRLLRVLQERQVMPLGAGKPISVNFAIVCATHRSLRQMVDSGQFREDLFYRLNGMTVKLPKLASRTDLNEIIRWILQTESGRVMTLDDAVLHNFQRYSWPGNLRQLSNILRTAIAMAGDSNQITLADLPDDFLEECQQAVGTYAADLTLNSNPPGFQVFEMPSATNALGFVKLDEQEKKLIEQTLQSVGGNISEAAKRLGISRNTIYRRLGKQ